jgi:4-hydroxy-tetrahydrodipicolinate synthase
MVTIGFEEGNGKVHLLGGAIDTSTKRIIERIKVLKQVGYKNIVVAPTFYITANHPTEHLRLFGECKEQCGAVNMIAYNIPSTTSSMIQSDVMTDMVKRGWITYCKDSSEDMEYFHRLVRDAVPLGLRVFLGTERKADEALLAGAVGLVPVNGNFEPQTFISAYENRTNKEELTRLQKRITSLVTNLLQTPRNWLAGIKYAVSSTHGIGSGRPVSPLEPLNEEEKRKMDEFIKATAPAATAVH